MSNAPTAPFAQPANGDRKEPRAGRAGINVSGLRRAKLAEAAAASTGRLELISRCSKYLPSGSMSLRTALITGASRGIGREVARTLASEGWHVLSAVRASKSAPPGTQAETVDMADRESIEALTERLRARHQRLDALVNNAGVYEGPARHIWNVNVLGPLRLTLGLETVLAMHARVVMVTSSLGKLSAQPASLVRRLSKPGLSLEELERLASEAPGGYGASKAALTVMARLFADRFRSRGILVNAISPGWVRTDMGGRSAPRSVEQGAASVLWGVRLPAGGPTGGAFADGKEMA